MKRILPEHVLLIATCLCMAVVASLLMAVSASGAPPRLKTFRGKVVKVVDADTIFVETRLVTRKVRLNEIDAPESDQPYGKEAADALAKAALGRTVVVNYRTKDRYQRFLGTVSLVGADGQPEISSLNAALVREGNAWQYDAYSKSEELAKLEAEAREKKKGLWSLPNPIYPPDWRKGKRE